MKSSRAHPRSVRARQLHLIATTLLTGALCGRIWAAAPLENEALRAEFDEHGLVSVVDKSTKRAIDIRGDNFSVQVDDFTISGDSAKAESGAADAGLRSYVYRLDRATVTVKYELKPGWHFLSKRLALSGVAAADYRLKHVEVWRSGTPTDVDTIKGMRGGIFLRLHQKEGGPADEGMFLAIQNPYMEPAVANGKLSLAYAPEMPWRREYGDFESDRVCLGLYALTGVLYTRRSVPEWKYEGKRVQADSLDWSEISAVTDCIRAFILNLPKRSIRVDVGWCENDYQIDVATPEGREQYKRIIEQAAAMGCGHVLFAPANSSLSSLKDNRDAWGWENVLWLGLGQKIRTGRWDPHKDEIPQDVADLQAFAKSKGMKLLAYVYPSLPFMQDPAWTRWIKGRPGGYLGADTGLRSFQDWLLDDLVTFHDRAGIGGYSFDHWFIAYDQPGASSKYAQWFGCRRVLETLRTKIPDVVVDGRQQYQQFGPWTWLGGSYPHPTSTDEQPQSFRAFPDLHIDRISADRQRYAAWWYRIENFCPPEIMPGFITHQTPRIDAKNVMRRDTFRARDWDLLGWKYSLISSIATAPINHVVNMIPARDEEEFKHFSDADKACFRSWLDWTDQNIDVLRNMRPILGQPMVGQADGSAAFEGGHGFVFLFNPNYARTEARFKLDKSIGLAAGGPLLIRQLYPEAEKGKLFSPPGGVYWTPGEEVAMTLPGVDALVLEVTPAPAAATAPVLFDSIGSVTERDGGLAVTGASGEAGSRGVVRILLRAGGAAKSVTVNGVSTPFQRKGDVIWADVTFAGDAFGRCPRIGDSAPNFSGGSYHAEASVPAAVFAQLQERKRAWPIPYSDDDLRATWLGPDRLLLFVDVADADDRMPVGLHIDGVAMPLQPAYSGIYPNTTERTFVGWYADVSALGAGVKHQFDLELPKLHVGQFQGLFLDNVEARFTSQVVPAARAGPQPRAANVTNQLLEGVRSIATPGLPGTVCAFGDDAFVVVALPAGPGRKGGSPIIAAAPYADGHVVLLGHTAYLDREALAKGDTSQLLKNLFRWAVHPKDGGAIRVGTAGRLDPARELSGSGIEVSSLGNDWRERMGDVDVLLMDAATVTGADVNPITAYIRKGGAVFFSETGWGWEQLHPGRALRDHPVNRLTAPIGLAFGSNSVPAGKGGVADVQVTADPLLHATAALDFLAGRARGPAATPAEKKELAAKRIQAAQTLLAASHVAPEDSVLMKRLAALRGATDRQYPTHEKPLRASDGLARVLFSLDFDHWQDRDPSAQKPYPGAAAFPGVVPADAARVIRVIHIDNAVPRWHSTGLYAAPGEVITASFPGGLPPKGLSIRIGAHSDSLAGATSLERPAEITGSWPLKTAITRVASPFGGLVYVEVGKSATNPRTVDVELAGAVEAPLFVAGVTSLDDWKSRIRSRPAPWAEVASGKLILTCPSEVVRTLDDPESLMKHWDRVLDADATLVGRPLERSSPERIVADVQISAGYMHSGYPIMTHLDVTRAMVDLKTLGTLDGGWGFYHELGHNHQQPEWTFPGTTEVTVNLFSMYVLETVCGLSPEEVTRRATTDDGHPERIKSYLAHPDFTAWCNEPFLALDMYARLRLAFGWEPYKKVFAEYRDLPADQRPKSPIDQHDQWMVRMSRAVGKNLGPFFEAWGIPTSAQARTSISGLPGWMPDGMSRDPAGR